mmetsp:Transcript_63125/g.87201  ORF Transcript_63125/g.87201 Transcript_63125/m.87201 type:complete len:118 (-) Transcript_63125:260-613(-)
MIQQGEETLDFFFIAKGECEVFVKDETHKIAFVKTLYPGDYFGEIALITGNPRSATVQTKNYSTLGKLTSEKFIELNQTFPEIRVKLKQTLKNYQDRYKVWLKDQLKRVAYLKDMSF